METSKTSDQSVTRNREDSATFTRCSSCEHAKDVDCNMGTLFCRRHEMFVNAEADEIPDACMEYKPTSPQAEEE